jgi:hypothetical protein
VASAVAGRVHWATQGHPTILSECQKNNHHNAHCCAISKLLAALGRTEAVLCSKLHQQQARHGIATLLSTQSLLRVHAQRAVSVPLVFYTNLQCSLRCLCILKRPRCHTLYAAGGVCQAVQRRAQAPHTSRGRQRGQQCACVCVTWLHSHHQRLLFVARACTGVHSRTT